MPDMFALPFRPAYDANGRTIPGAQAWFTLTGTNVETPIYSDLALTIELPNPLVSDGLGKFPRAYLDPDVDYRLRVYTEDAVVGVDSPIPDHDYDPYTGTEQGPSGPPGTPGEDGEDGTDGVNATVISGTVNTTTLSAGSSATASAAHIGGGVYQLSLGIPAGPSGILSDGTYGDIVVTIGGTVLTVGPNAIITSKLADNAVTTAKITDANVTTAKIADGNVTAGKLASDAVTTVKILDANVTDAKLADMATATVKGRATGAGTGAPSSIAIGAGAATSILDRAAGDARYLQAANDRTFSIFIPASAMTARATNGAAANSYETSTNKINYDVLEFAATEYAQFFQAMPKSWNEGTITAQFIWAAGGTGTVTWGIQGRALSDDDVLDSSFGTSQTVTDTVTAATDLMQSAFTSAVTLAGTPAEGDTAIFQVFRSGGTLATDARLIGIRLNFTVNAADDS